MTGEEFIQLAGRLAVIPGADAACFRSAVSRAYYGAFHLARDLLEELGFAPPKNANVHGFIQQQLIASGQPDAYRAGLFLSDLHGDRNKADYRLDDPRWETADFARLAVERAHDIKTALAACGDEPARSDLQAGIAEYQSKLDTP